MNKWSERLKVALAELRLARKALNEAQRRVDRLEAQVANGRARDVHGHG